jgi:hypothetical protein
MGALSWLSVAIPPILQVMLFLWGMHSHYQDLLSQFALKHKDFSLATIDSIVADAHFMDEFIVVRGKTKPGAQGPSLCYPSAALVVTNKEGKEFRTPWEWLASYNLSSVMSWWCRSLRGNFYCPFCNRIGKHHPLKCPLLGELGLKITEVGGQGGGVMPGSSLSGSSASGASGGVKPASSSPPAAVPAAVVSPPVPNSGSTSAPAGLTAAVKPDNGRDESLADNFWWYGDDDGANYKPNRLVSNYFLLCSRVSSESVPLLASHVGSVMCGSSSNSVTSDDDIILSRDLVSSLIRAISPADLHCLVVADMGVTNHMLPDRLAFISYKLVWYLCVRMGNNSYAPVLGQGTTNISLNEQHLLIRNMLHFLALRVLLYSLCAHLRQRGCGFMGSFDTEMHVYFPGVVLSVDMSINCHHSYKPFAKSTPLSSLHYVQPHCPPVLYPAKSSAFRVRTGADPSPKLRL